MATPTNSNTSAPAVTPSQRKSRRLSSDGSTIQTPPPAPSSIRDTARETPKSSSDSGGQTGNRYMRSVHDWMDQAAITSATPSSPGGYTSNSFLSSDSESDHDETDRCYCHMDKNKFLVTCADHGVWARLSFANHTPDTTNFDDYFCGRCQPFFLMAPEEDLWLGFFSRKIPTCQ
jgi:hypothetical protein